MRKFTKAMGWLLTAAMLLSLLCVGAFAASGEPSGEGGGASGSSGMSADLSGVLALKQYVFVKSQGEVSGDAISVECYGMYEVGAEGEAAYAPAPFEGKLAVYADSAKEEELKGISAEVKAGALTLSGIAAEGNTAYYLSNTDEDGGVTTLYVVCDEYAENTATLYLPDGTSINLTTYAPNMRYGNYTADVDNNYIDGETAVFIGANRTALTLADMTDTENFAGHEAAAAWYLRSGITNAGESLTRFGDKLYGYEYAVGLYRLFQIVVDQITSVAGYTDPADFVGAMFSNDPYSDAVSATLQANVWNGIYTQMSDVKDLGEGFYLTENIDGVTTLGTGAVVTAKFAYVGMYNAFASDWTMLNADGEALAAELEAAAAAFDGKTVTRPDDYTNEAKIAAVSAVLLGEAAAPAGDETLTKAEAVEILYAASPYVMAKVAPDESRVAATGSDYANMLQYFGEDYGTTTIVTEENLAAVQAEIDGMDLIVEENAALVVNNAGELTVTNNTISLAGNANAATDVLTGLSDPRYALDGQEAATDPTHDGFVYNATTRNAFYRFGVGTALGVMGKDSVVNLRSDNGTLVLDGNTSGTNTQAGDMAGTAFVGFGGIVNITNAVAYSSSQHLSNLLYNGSVHYKDAMAVGAGRVFSSDFWGGYQVFEDTVASGGSVTDEPTTVIIKNCVYGNSVGGNGFGSQYIENSILNISTASFDNKTSLVTDCGSWTVVNSLVNCSGATLAKTTGCERGIMTFVDSEIILVGNGLAAVGNRDGVNAITDITVDPANLEEYKDRWDGEMAMYFYGENSIDTADGILTVDVAEGAKLTIYSANLKAADLENLGAGELVVVTDAAYGTLEVK